MSGIIIVRNYNLAWEAPGYSCNCYLGAFFLSMIIIPYGLRVVNRFQMKIDAILKYDTQNCEKQLEIVYQSEDQSRGLYSVTASRYFAGSPFNISSAYATGSL